jgi:hypothetical protein
MRKLVKRMQRKALGGMVYARLYDDGTVRVRVDHPSDDPAVEIAMTASVIRALQETYRNHGLPAPKLAGPLTWRSDP